MRFLLSNCFAIFLLSACIFISLVFCAPVITTSGTAATSEIRVHEGKSTQATTGTDHHLDTESESAVVTRLSTTRPKIATPTPSKPDIGTPDSEFHRNTIPQPGSSSSSSLQEDPNTIAPHPLSEDHNPDRQIPDGPLLHVLDWTMSFLVWLARLLLICLFTFWIGEWVMTACFGMPRADISRNQRIRARLSLAYQTFPDTNITV